MDMSCRTTRENIREPAGETHTFVPRPRPATWTVAEAVKPVGRRRRICVFLSTVSAVHTKHQPRKRGGKGRVDYFSSMVLVLVTTSP